jgi:hypothetical protein
MGPLRSRYGSSHLARFGRIETNRRDAVLLERAGTSFSFSWKRMYAYDGAIRRLASRAGNPESRTVAAPQRGLLEYH